MSIAVVMAFLTKTAPLWGAVFSFLTEYFSEKNRKKRKGDRVCGDLDRARAGDRVVLER